jgi:hypothetical protein
MTEVGESIRSVPNAELILMLLLPGKDGLSAKLVIIHTIKIRKEGLRTFACHAT